MNNRDYPVGADGESPPWKDDPQYRDCPLCDGTGFTHIDKDDPENDVECPKCEGTGQVEITQEDIDDEEGYYDERI
jgi:DnaJ-class molecular chaperone